MNLDLRIPTGMMFTLIGAVLMALGLASRDNPALYINSLGIDVNFWWGVVLLVFGLVFVTFGRRGQMKIEKQRQAGESAGQRVSKSAVRRVSKSAGRRSS